MDRIITQLVDIYINKEEWHNTKLTNEEAYNYFEKKLLDDNIVYYEENGEVLGYMECWFMDYEQLRRFVGGGPFDPHKEDLKDGDYCYVSDIYIEKKYRGNGMLNKLRYIAYQAHGDYKPKLIVLNDVKHNRRLRVFKGGNHGK